MKKILLLTFFLLTSIKVFSQDPIAWYQFTAGNFSNSYGANNFTKTGNNATIQDGRDGVTEDAIDLNADILSATTPTPSDASSRNLTISFWIKNNLFNTNTYKVLLNSLNTLNHPVFFNNTNTALAQQNTGYMVRAVAGGVQVKALHKDQFNNIMFAHTFTSGNLNDGNWHHIAIRLIVENKSTSNPSFRDVNLLTILDVDGNSSNNRSSVQRISRSDADAINPFYQSGDFTIGGIPTSNLGDKYNGEIDDLVIFDRTLANAEIAELNAPKRDVFQTNINGIINFYPQSNSIKYINGMNVQLTAQPNSGYGFTNWSRDLTGSTNPVTINIDKNKDIEANFSATASIHNYNKFKFTLSANPVRDFLKIKTLESIQNIIIYDLVGKKIKEFATKEIDISQLSKGSYILKVITKNGKIGIKRIVRN